jgi:hypothetical protein
MSALAILGHFAADATAELVARVRVAARVLWWGSALGAQQMHHMPVTRPAGGAPDGTDAAVGDDGKHRHSSSNAHPGASSVAPPLDGFRTSRAAEGSQQPRTSSSLCSACRTRADEGDHATCSESPLATIEHERRRGDTAPCGACGFLGSPCACVVRATLRAC